MRGLHQLETSSRAINKPPKKTFTKKNGRKHGEISPDLLVFYNRVKWCKEPQVPPKYSPWQLNSTKTKEECGYDFNISNFQEIMKKVEGYDVEQEIDITKLRNEAVFLEDVFFVMYRCFRFHCKLQNARRRALIGMEKQKQQNEF